jgi:nucleotide-binding universal stress UspA family protein
MSGRIVVGVDGSEGGRRALEWAWEEARQQRAELIVVHAWEYSAGCYGVITTNEESARADLAECMRQFETEGVTVRTRMIDGRAVPVLLHEARHADLLVVGSRGHGRVSNAVLGSVSMECIHRAVCPVVVIPPGYGAAPRHDRQEETEDDPSGLEAFAVGRVDPIAWATEPADRIPQRVQRPARVGES